MDGSGINKWPLIILGVVQVLCLIILLLLEDKLLSPNIVFPFCF